MFEKDFQNLLIRAHVHDRIIAQGVRSEETRIPISLSASPFFQYNEPDLKKNDLHALVAQWIEQGPSKTKAAGSIPAEGTRKRINKKLALPRKCEL